MDLAFGVLLAGTFLVSAAVLLRAALEVSGRGRRVGFILISIMLCSISVIMLVGMFGNKI